MDSFQRPRGMPPPRIKPLPFEDWPGERTSGSLWGKLAARILAGRGAQLAMRVPLAPDPVAPPIEPPRLPYLYQANPDRQASTLKKRRITYTREVESRAELKEREIHK